MSTENETEAEYWQLRAEEEAERREELAKVVDWHMEHVEKPLLDAFLRALKKETA